MPKWFGNMFRKKKLEERKSEERKSVSTELSTINVSLNEETSHGVNQDLGETIVAKSEDSQKAKAEDIPGTANIYGMLTETLGPVCGPDSCVRDCGTCGPDEPVNARTRKRSKRKTVIDLNMFRLSKTSQKSSTSEESQSKVFRKSSEDIEIMDEGNAAPNVLVANPIGTVSLGEALALLMRQDLEPDSQSGQNTTFFKSAVSTTHDSSSEASNTDLLQISPRVTHRSTFKSSIKSKSEPLPSVFVDEAVNTSNLVLPVPAQAQKIDDSLVQLKFRSQLNEDSCTQYFALRSTLQFEPYLQSIRKEKGQRRTTPDRITFSVDQANVEHQKGLMKLSIASIVNDAGSDIGQALPADDTHIVETELVALNLDPPEIDIMNQLGTKVSLGSITTDKPQLETCRRCKQSERHEYYNRPSWLAQLAEMQRQTQESNEEESKTIDSSFMINSTTNSEFEQEAGFIDHTLDETTVDNQQFVLVLQMFKPSKDIKQFSTTRYEIEQTPYFIFRWNFLKFSDSCAFSFNKDYDSVDLSYLKSYNFTISTGLYLYLLKCPMAIELYYSNYISETLIGKCNLKIGRCFDDTNKIYESALEVQNKDLCLCFDNMKRMNFGELICRYRMRGEQAKYDECVPIKPPFLKIPPLIEASESRVTPISSIQTMHGSYKHQSGSAHHSSLRTSTAVVSEAELQAFQDGLNLVLVRNKALRTTQEEITNELKDRTTWMHEELKWRLTLQENAILCGRDPAAVKWRQWKDDTTASVRYRPISHEEFFKDGLAHIEIEILELLLRQESKPMNDENLTHVYIEFAFLTYSGKQMETPTMRKPMEERPIRIKFKKMFNINIEDKEAKMLADLIKNNESITFTVISQPMEGDEVQCCYDFGIANLVLFDLLQSRHNTATENLTVYDSYNQEKTIGTLKIKFVGVLAMRSMALHILTPDSFKIIR